MIPQMQLEGMRMIPARLDPEGRRSAKRVLLWAWYLSYLYAQM
jgi:hypothetical protein